MMDHPTSEHLYEFLDGSLGGKRYRAVAGHLDRCAECRRQLDLARGIERAARGIVASTSPGFTDAVMSRILADATRPAPAVEDARSGVRPLSGARRFTVPGALVAIYLTVMLVIGFGSYRDDGGGGKGWISGWISDALAPLVNVIEAIGGISGRVVSGGIVGILFIVVVAIAGLLTIDGLVGRRLPRGRH